MELDFLGNWRFTLIPRDTSLFTYVPVLLLLVAIWALLVARRALADRSVRERRRATLELVLRRETSDEYRRISEHFSHLRRSGRLAALNSPAEVDRGARRDVLEFLNHYEIVALGIRSGVFDATFYREWMAGPLVRDWNDARQFIQGERWKAVAPKGWSYRASVYEHLEWLALSWSSEAKPLTRKNRGYPTAVPGPAGAPLPVIDDPAQ